MLRPTTAVFGECMPISMDAAYLYYEAYYEADDELWFGAILKPLQLSHSRENSNHTKPFQPFFYFFSFSILIKNIVACYSASYNPVPRPFVAYIL